MLTNRMSGMRAIVTKATDTGASRRAERAWAAALALGLAFCLGTGGAAAQTPCRPYPFVTTDRTSLISCLEGSDSEQDIRIVVRNPDITTTDRSGIYAEHSGIGGIDINVQGGSIETTGTAARGVVARHSGTGGSVGDIRVDVTGGTIVSGGDGVHASYVMTRDNDGAIAVTVAEGASVTGGLNGIYVGGAGRVMESGSRNLLRDQTVTVNGVVTGGTGAGVRMTGGRQLIVGRTGRIGADSGMGVLAEGPGDFHAMVDGRVDGDIHHVGNGNFSATVMGTVDGDVEGSGGRDHTVSVPVGGTVMGTIRLAGSTVPNTGVAVTVGGEVGRITIDNEGTVMVDSTGQVTGVSAGSHGVRVGRGSTVENRGTIEGTIGIQAGAGSRVINSGTVRSTEADGIAIDFPDSGANTLTLMQGSMISGKIRGLDTLDLSDMAADEIGLLTFVNETARESITIMPPTGRIINAGNTIVGLNTTAFALTDEVLSDLTGSIHAAVIDNGLPAHAHENNPARRRVWATPFGGAREQNGDNWLADGTHYFGGGLLGADWGTDTRIGVFVGGSVGQLDVTDNRHTIDIQTVFGGVYARQELGDMLLDARMLIGSMNHDSARRVGPSTAKVEYTALLLSPEVSVAMRLPVASRLHATPRLRVRYTKLATEGFRERAPDTNWDLRFAERDVQVLEARGEVGLPLELESGGRIEPRVGIEGRWLLAGEMVEAAVPGGAFRVSAGGETGVATGTIGFGLTLPVAESTALVGNFDGAYTMERAWRATGYFGLIYSF